MNTALADMFVATISEGLRSKTVNSADRWAMRYRKMGPPIPGPFNFTAHPWLREMHKSKCEVNVGMKAAQMGFTETMLNIAFFSVDQKHLDVLYILPNTVPDAHDFSARRFDVALELSDYIKNMFSQTRNVGMKGTKTNCIYVRGSRSQSGLVSIPVGVVIGDEVDRFDEAAIPLMTERMSGHATGLLWLISTPRVPKAGIAAQYDLTDQRHFIFRCPHCSRATELIYPDCLVVVGDDAASIEVERSYLICKECKHTLLHEQKTEFLKDGWWEPTVTGRSAAGFHIPQLYSIMLPAWKLAKMSLLARYDAAVEQELYNSKLGLPHIVSSINISDEDINNAIRDYVQDDKSRLQQRSIVTIGVDVGSMCHYIVMQWFVKQNRGSVEINQDANGRMIACGTFKDLDTEVDALIKRYSAIMTVIDAEPETKSAMRVAKRHPGKVRLCHYGNKVKTKDILDHGFRITVDRTMWIDQTLSRFSAHSIALPKNIPPEYRAHVKALVRVYEKNAQGERVASYIKAGDDHYAHAQNYAEIALGLCDGLGESSDAPTTVY